MKKYLFIGGPLHLKWIEVVGKKSISYFRIPEKSEIGIIPTKELTAHPYIEERYLISEYMGMPFYLYEHSLTEDIDSQMLSGLTKFMKEEIYET